LSARDNRYDGLFVYGVLSTRVYCRPSCSSRKPQPHQVVLFSNPKEASEEGFRACLRCKPDETEPIVAKIARICAHIDAHPERVLTLKALGEAFGLGPHHLQRSFKRIMGVSPRQYAEGARLKKLKRQLREGDSVRRSTYDAGMSSTGWLYESRGPKLGMAASSYRQGGSGRRVAYSVSPCSLGYLLVAGTEKGVCMVGLGGSEREMLGALRKEYPRATLVPEPREIANWVKAVVDYIDGRGDDRLSQIPLEIRATAFQRRVWNELRSIPIGSTKTYGEVAKSLGQPRAVRAVARACATNPVALVIPCHRVIGKDGSLTGYRWGVERKKALLRIEEGQVAESDH